MSSRQEDINALICKDGPGCGSQPNALRNTLKWGIEALVGGTALVAALQGAGNYPLPVAKSSQALGESNFSQIGMRRLARTGDWLRDIHEFARGYRLTGEFPGNTIGAGRGVLNNIKPAKCLTAHGHPLGQWPGDIGLEASS